MTPEHDPTRRPRVYYEEENPYPVTDEQIQHGKKFWKLIAWGFGIFLSILAWCGLIYWTFLKK